MDDKTNEKKRSFQKYRDNFKKEKLRLTEMGCLNLPYNFKVGIS